MSYPLPIVAIVVPCYNEKEILANSLEILSNKLKDLASQGIVSGESYILCVDDGSIDCTWEIIKSFYAKPSVHVRGIRLSANSGHQNALWAGLKYACNHTDAIISLDADLQDDIEVFKDFVAEYKNGVDIVYGVRNDRRTDSFVKRSFAELFYKMMAFLGVTTVYNHADFRLMSQRAVKALLEYEEVNLYIRGLVPLLGFRHSVVLYARKPATRPTHYSIAKMLRLVWDGVTSFSIRPIQCISALGVLFLVLGLALLTYTCASYFYLGSVSPWSCLFTLIISLGAVQLLSLGLIGEYIAKTYIEVKHRPKYHICDTLDSGDRPSS